MKIYPAFFLIFFLFCPFILAEETNHTLEKLILSLSTDNEIIVAKKNYETSIVEQKYQYLQWWEPSIILNNSLIYPYKYEYFEDIASSNITSLVFSTPLPSGTILDLSASYGLNRDLLNSGKFGFSQELQAKIGIAQSLNPWWIHTANNPYKAGMAIQSSLAKNGYNSSVKSILFTCLQEYIFLRKAERNSTMLNEKISLYNDMITAYREMQANGGISRREFQNIRTDKWEDEQSLFTLEQEINTHKSELYKMTGIQVGSISSENLIDINSNIWDSLFLDIHREDISHTEERSVRLQKEALQIEQTIANQLNSPSVKFELGTSVILPVQDKDSLGNGWKKENFDNNILNNWSLTVSIDFSKLFTPSNKKNTLIHNVSQKSLDELLVSIYLEKEKSLNLNQDTINLLGEHIEKLKAIITNEELNLIDDKIMLERGAITLFEYRQSEVSFRSRHTLLTNLTDDLWLYKLLQSFL